MFMGIFLDALCYSKKNAADQILSTYVLVAVGPLRKPILENVDSSLNHLRRNLN